MKSLDRYNESHKYATLISSSLFASINHKYLPQLITSSGNINCTRTRTKAPASILNHQTKAFNETSFTLECLHDAD